ncbi:unnamed protein product [Moneuplotes crassus]|uniref:Uncharacterized protein n=1 Tax=Euplotes crassus TaxID=5936 RepID=A0AAD1UK70_EUPCR|nr:unnamed protein product [Moneuplotes crassus]
MEATSVKIQNKRIAKEVRLLKNLPKEMLFGKIEKTYGVVIRIEIQSSLIKSELLNPDIEKLYFEILLTERFPLQAPQVYCKTKIGYPTIDDKRDILEEIIHKEWSNNMTIFETIELIPQFVADLLLQMQQEDEIKSIGKWHLGQSYPLKDMGIGLFAVREETETLDGFQYNDRYIAVYENSFFLFEPDRKHKGMAKLLTVATLCSLEKIVRNLDMPEYVTFIWRKMEDQRYQWVLKVEIQNYVECINLIVKYLKLLEISVQKKYMKKRKILASEVNDKAIKKTNESVLLQQVEEAEKAIEEQINNKSVKNLMDSYQKAIEYYSALDNKCFEDFLNRMTNLFKREEIQKALSQPEEEEEKVEEVPSKNASGPTSDTQGSDTSTDALKQEDVQPEQPIVEADDPKK